MVSVDIEKVMIRLTEKIAALEYENAILRAQIEVLEVAGNGNNTENAEVRIPQAVAE